MDSPVWNIILVEDSEDDYILTRAMLDDVKRGEYRLAWALDVQQALSLVGEQCPDVLLVDYSLGIETGLDFVRKVRERGCSSPAILLTGHSSYSLDVEAMKAGVDDFLEKRYINGPLLERAIRYAIERRQNRAALERMTEALEQRVAERTRELAEANRQLEARNLAMAATNISLCKSSQMIEDIFTNMHLAIAYLDRDFNFIRVNRNYAQADEKPVEYFIGKNHFDLYPNAENEALFREVVETGEPYFAFAKPFVYEHSPERGMTYWDWTLQPVKDADGTVTGVILSLLDVTEREKTRLVLKETEARLQAVVTGAPMIIWAVDRRGMITLSEGKGLARLGLRPGQMTGHYISEYSERYPDMADILNRALSGEEVIEIFPIGDDPGEVLETRFSPLFDDQREIAGVICISTFITERIRAEEQARRAAYRVETQLEITRMLAEAKLDVQAIMDQLAFCTAELIGDACIVTRYDEEQQLLVPVSYHHADPAVDEFMGEIAASPSNVQMAAAEKAASTGRPVLIGQVAEQETTGCCSPDFKPYLERSSVHSLLVVPIKQKDRVIGTIGLSRDYPGNPYTVEDQTLLESLAAHTALSISNAYLYHAAQSELAERKRIEAELNEIQTRLIDDAESERVQLARELHDGPMQDLYGLSLQLRMLLDVALGMTDEFEQIQASIQRIIDSLRATSMDLRPPSLMRFGLEAAISSHCEQYKKMQPDLNIHLNFSKDDPDANGCAGMLAVEPLSERVRLALFRIYQMGLTNVVRHAQAKNVTISIYNEPHSVTMEIQDDGKGFQVPERWIELARKGHLGLVGAVERVEALGGKMQVISGEGAGTTIRVTVPRDA